LAVETALNRDITPGSDSDLIERPEPPIWWLLLQLAALSFHFPLGLLTGPQRAVSSVASVIAVGVAVTTCSLFLYLIIRRLTGSGWRSLGVVSVGVLLFWQGSGVTASSDLAAFGANILIAGLVFAATYKFCERRLFKLLAFAGSVTLGVTYVVLIIVAAATTPEPVVEAKNPIGPVSLSSKPDIYLILLDGYGREDVIRDFYGHDNSDFLGELRTNGFDVADRSSSNYTITHLSLPSILNMSYMNDPLDFMNNSDLERLSAAASGDNALVRTLKAEGYTYVHGDSDHWFNTCGPAVDVCLPGPLIDVTAHTLLATTPIGDIFYPESGDPTTALNRTRIDQMTHWSERKPDVAAPTFTFLHLVLPHPPLYLDSACEPHIDPDLRGRIVNNGAIDEDHLEKRRQAWVDQVECANATVLQFLEQIEDDAVVVVTSDHGPDSTFIIDTSDVTDLTRSRLEERMPNLTAVRMPAGCEGTLPADIHLVNLFRVLLDCLSDDDIETLDNRYFAASFGGSVIELKYSDPLTD
jgi:hypothetical protein